MLIVAAAQLSEPRPTAMFLSQSLGYRYRLYYEIHAFLLSFVLFYYGVFLDVILMVVLMSVMAKVVIVMTHLYGIR
jgi:hypothetical protein